MKREALDNCIFHYTSAQALLAIIQTRTLWATDIEYLNDAREGTLARKMIKHLMGSVDAERSGDFLNMFSGGRRSFVSCFSKTYKNLSMYRTYGTPFGTYCLGIDRDALEAIDGIKVVECVYDKGDQARYCKEVVGQVGSGRSLQAAYAALLDLETRFKGEEFHTEEEIRLLAQGEGAVDLRVSGRGNFLIPYRQIDLPNGPIPVLVTLGPNTDAHLARRGIQELRRFARMHGTQWEIHFGIWELTGYRYIG